MAERRMFAKSIIDSDLFLDMPATTQNLYFHLAMRADDDGFVNSPQKIMRMVSCSKNDMDMLIFKNFIIPFETGICVIKHWRIHNYIRNDRYTPTIYTEEKNQLTLDDSKSYTFGMSVGLPSGIPDVIPVGDVGKVSIDNKKDIVVSDENDVAITEIVSYLNEKTGKKFKASTSSTVKHIRGRLREGYSVEDFKRVIDTKCRKWLGDARMNDYLRPDTLFNPTNFESYVNESESVGQISGRPKNQMPLVTLGDEDLAYLERVYEGQAKQRDSNGGWNRAARSLPNLPNGL